MSSIYGIGARKLVLKNSQMEYIEWRLAEVIVKDSKNFLILLYILHLYSILYHIYLKSIHLAVIKWMNQYEIHEMRKPHTIVNSDENALMFQNCGWKLFKFNKVSHRVKSVFSLLCKVQFHKHKFLGLHRRINSSFIELQQFPFKWFLHTYHKC